MVTHFYIIRHGETDWNKISRIQGHTDILLNKTGLLQADKIGQRLSMLPIEMICTSDLSRAFQTAEAIKKWSPHIPMYCYPELRERNYGYWEGKTSEEFIQCMEIEGDSALYKMESATEVQRRGLWVLEQIRAKYPVRHIAIVSHGGLINVLLRYFSISEGGYDSVKTKLGNTAFNYVSWSQDGWMVHTINDTSHLL